MCQFIFSPSFHVILQKAEEDLYSSPVRFKKKNNNCDCRILEWIIVAACDVLARSGRPGIVGWAFFFEKLLGFGKVLASLFWLLGLPSLLLRTKEEGNTHTGQIVSIWKLVNVRLFEIPLLFFNKEKKLLSLGVNLWALRTLLVSTATWKQPPLISVSLTSKQAADCSKEIIST